MSEHTDPSSSRGARPIGEVLKALLRRKRFYEKGKHAGLTRAWAELVGEGIAARTRVRSFREGKLVVEVSSSVLMHELSGFMREQLLTGLQACDGGRDVVEVRFCLGNGAEETDGGD